MHLEILNQNQLELLPYLSNFNRTFYLVGGTAIALHLGHRRSIDFDLFTPSKLNLARIKAALLKMPFKQVSIFEDYDQMHLMINNVKVTFFNYPYPINHPIKIEKQITIPSLLTLSAMKAFALGRRAKWKDYVDLYFILKDFYAIEEVANEAIKLFPTQFSEKLFRQQLAFHKDIDYSEPVEYIVPEVSDKLIKEFLINRAIDIFKP
jgi:hypothetical protein